MSLTFILQTMIHLRSRQHHSKAADKTHSRDYNRKQSAKLRFWREGVVRWLEPTSIGQSENGTPVQVFVVRAVQFTVLIRHQSQHAYVDFRLVQCCRGGSRQLGHVFRVGYATGHISARQAWKEPFNHGMWLEDASSGGVTVPSWMAPWAARST